MVEVKSYHLPPTALIPNSPQPILHYPGFFSEETITQIYDIFTGNGWQVQWIFRYGPTQRAHYHSAAHECMAVLSGKATIRFGVADTVPDLEENTSGSGREEGGVEIEASKGDVFILPAGTAHKTFKTSPVDTFVLLTPGEGHSIASDNPREALAKIELSGFTMIGAYPGDSVWDFFEGGEHVGEFERIWSVKKPDSDPVLGRAPTGLVGLWH